MLDAAMARVRLAAIVLSLVSNVGHSEPAIGSQVIVFANDFQKHS
jgi:hypothetical protein